MNFRCQMHGEYIESDDCPCQDSEDCPQYITRMEKEQAMAALHDTEVGMAMRKVLGQLTAVPVEEIDKIVDLMFASAYEAGEQQMRSSLNIAVQAKAAEYIDKKAEGMLDKMFDEAMDREMLQLGKDGDTVTAKIHDIVMNRMKKFFVKKDGYNDRSMDKALDQLIAAKVDGMVEDAITELKKESIEKFNKEILKKMMVGMTSAIQNDKRLLAVLGT